MLRACKIPRRVTEQNFETNTNVLLHILLQVRANLPQPLCFVMSSLRFQLLKIVSAGKRKLIAALTAV